MSNDNKELDSKDGISYAWVERLQNESTVEERIASAMRKAIPKGFKLSEVKYNGGLSVTYKFDPPRSTPVEPTFNKDALQETQSADDVTVLDENGKLWHVTGLMPKISDELSAEEFTELSVTLSAAKSGDALLDYLKNIAIADAHQAKTNIGDRTAVHELKSDPAIFHAVDSGLQSFELRYNDRNYQVGDVVLLRETVFTGKEMADGAELIYSGRNLIRRITYILSGYGLGEGWVVMGTVKDEGDA